MPYSNPPSRKSEVQPFTKQLRAEEEELCRELAGLGQPPRSRPLIGVAEPKQSEEVLPYAVLTPKKAFLTSCRKIREPTQARKSMTSCSRGEWSPQPRRHGTPVLSRQNGRLSAEWPMEWSSIPFSFRTSLSLCLLRRARQGRPAWSSKRKLGAVSYFPREAEPLAVLGAHPRRMGVRLRLLRPRPLLVHEPPSDHPGDNVAPGRWCPSPAWPPGLT